MSNIDKLLYIDGLGEITQNLNIGGNLNVTNNINIANNLNVDKINGYSSANNIDIGSSIEIRGQTFDANIVNATQYNFKGIAMISSTRQANFTTLEIKHSTDSSDIKCLINNGNNGILEIDKITGITDANNIDIGSSIEIRGQTFDANIVNATQYNFKGIAMISSTRQANFTTLEIKHSTDSSDIKCLINNGNNGILEIDKITGITDANNIDIGSSIEIRGQDFSAHTVNVTGVTTLSNTLSLPNTFNVYKNAQQTVHGPKTYKLKCEGGLIMHGNPIILRGDSNHYIIGSTDTDIDGVEISGCGGTNSSGAARSLFRVISSSHHLDQLPDSHGDKLIEIYQDKIDLNKNTEITGILNVTGATTLSDTLNVSADSIISGNLIIGHDTSTQIFLLNNPNDYKLYFGRIHALQAADAIQDYSIGIGMQGDVQEGFQPRPHPYNNLDIQWHTGINICSARDYGGTRFYNRDFGATTPPLKCLFSVGDQSDVTKVENGNFEVVNGYGLFKGTGSDTLNSGGGVALGAYNSEYGNIQIMSTLDGGGWIDWVVNGGPNDNLLGRIRYNKNSGFKYTASPYNNSPISHTFTMPDTNPIISFFTNRVELYKELFMQDNQINFRSNDDRNHTIAFSSATMDGLLFRGWGGSGACAFRFIAAQHGSPIMDLFYNKITMYKQIYLTNGNLNIGNTNTPNTRIYLNCINDMNSNARIEFQRSGNLACRIGYEPGYQKFELKNETGTIEYFTTNNHNFIGPGGRLAFQSDRNLVIYPNSGGAVWASNTSTSERRFKDNIISLDLENSYNIIKQLNPVSFVYKEDPNTPKKGFIVDEIEDKIPECIKEIINEETSEDMNSKLLYKEDIVPDLVASVQFLISKVETLENQLLTQSTLISNLQSQINSN